jgi:hypothetical protein
MREAYTRNQQGVVSKKKSYVLRIDEEVYEALEKWASDEFRSLNGQLEWLIHQQLIATGRLKSKEEKSKKSNTKR